MQGKQLAKVSVIALGVAIAVVLAPGCSGRCDGRASTNLNGRVLFRVIQRVNDNGWKTFAEIIITSDGSYRWITYDLSNQSHALETKKGHLPDELVKELADDVFRGRFETVGGVPTYQYGIDHLCVKHPRAIKQLFSVLHERHGTHLDLWPLPVFRNHRSHNNE